MSQAALIEALRRKGAEKAREIWSGAEADAAALREKMQERLREESSRAACDRQAQDSAAARAILREGERQGSRVREEAKRVLEGRLRDIAERSLNGLRAQGYPGRFKALAAELPSSPWEEVSVHPEDLGLAEETFSGCRVVTDPQSAGGFTVRGGEGRLVVINTLEKRLERAWPEILPRLLKRALAQEDSP